MTMKRLVLIALGSLFFAATVQAQFQIKGGTFNSLRATGTPVDPDGTPPVVSPQFAGAGVSSATSGPVASAEGYPYQPGRLLLLRSSFGGVFASGVPRYSLGDEIQRPSLAWDDSGPVPASYWRAKPVASGEVITQLNASQVIPVPLANDSYYYSPHANRVFAHRPGRTSITWMTLAPVAGEFRFKTEVFDVSSGTNFPVRTVYWTERGFRSPSINVPTGQIVTVNPVYSTFFPSTVATEYQGIGYVAPDPGSSLPPELRTLWFDNTAGLGQLRAFNREGRIFVEYLGALSGADQSVHEFLGADIVEVKQVIEPSIVTVNLGEQILPHETATKVAKNPDFLQPAAVLNLAQDAVTYYGTSARPDGQLIYHAEWENKVPDKVAFYWLERNDAGIHFVDAPGTPGLEIAWPKYLNKYRQVWPGPISAYAGVTVEDTGSTADTGVQFNGGNIPEVIFQDDGAQSEVSIDLNSQRLVADFSASADKTNRSLLKFSNGSGVWYQRLFIQSQSVLGSLEIPEVPDPDGNGPLEGTPFIPAVQTLADLNADGIRDLSSTAGVPDTNVVVGQRIERPDPSFEVAGFIAEGDSYLPAAYQDPFIAGVDAASSGAIIPVNAIPGSNELTIWWFKEVKPPNASFEPFYVPSKSGRYNVRYPGSSVLGSELTGSTIASGRNSTTSTLLDDGQVLVAGGYAGGTALATAETYDPATGTWTATAGPLATARFAPSVTRLQNGKVLVAAGYGGGVLNSAELYDPTTRTWTSAGVMGVARYGHKATLLPNGKVLVIGGLGSGDNRIASCELYDPITNTWSATGNLGANRYANSVTLLPNGKVLVVGGNPGGSSDYQQSAEIYDPATGTWTPAASAASKRAYQTASMLPNGKVLIAGGREDDNTVIASAELYDPASNTWTSAGSLVAGRFSQVAIVLPDGSVVVVGGNGSGNTLEVYDPELNSWAQRGTLLAFRESGFCAELLDDGSILVAGGFNGGQVSERVSWLEAPDQIILASNAGSGDLASFEASGEIYFQNDRNLPGYNPNEEHAMLLSGRAYAMREDLNVTASGPNYTSEPFVLVSYTDPADARPAVRAFEVLREIDQNDDDIVDPGDVLFNYEVTAGAAVPSPMPLPLLSLPVDSNGNVPNREVGGVLDLAPDRSGPVVLYDEFTFQDRKGYSKVYRGPHDGGSPTMGMQFYYLMRNGFFIPGLGTQPAEGTVLPYLRPEGVTGTLNLNDTPLTIVYRPVWPDAVPELRIGETLTLPKFGLPQVRGQSSARVLYEQSIALSGPNKPSVTLHDPTHVKTVLLGSHGLDAIPDTIATTLYQGRTYFQRLAPHLQQRFYATTGADPQLYFLGEFVDEIAGEDYLDLNVLSVADVAALEGLVDENNPDRTAWENAIAGLSTAVETYIENPARKGTYIVGSSVPVSGTSIAKITDSDTSVDSYALTASGDAVGYVSLLFGDGEAFTAQGDPVSIAVVKVVPKLYVGDMKVLFSSNPLDEQVSLRHSGDFAAKPELYDFDWRYHAGSVSEVYAIGTTDTVLDNATIWTKVQNPDTALETSSNVAVPRSLTIYNADYNGGNLPGVLMRSNTDVDFSAGLPGQIIFSADLSNSLDGFVLYVNGIAALGFRAPAPFENSNPVTGLSGTGLPSQFELNRNYFSKGINTIEIALYSSADPLFASSVNFRLQTISKVDQVVGNNAWESTNPNLLNQITLGGSPTAPLGDPLLIMQDNSFTMRYRPKLGSTAEQLLTAEGIAHANQWSDWMEPKLIPGWVKRVLDAINPYNQRMTDLYNNAVNTDVSVLTQAGTRWEGDIALNLDNINDAGLIEIYETVLNRAKLFSIDNGYDLAGTNDALLLAAGYLNDLYVILGNEAYADAANPTISLDNQDTVTEVSSSRFSFEGQVPSVLEEELALLRGRDDFLSTSIGIAPAYNRLYWNYTNGIEAGEVLYATNYNIKEKAGSETANGIIDAKDAQRMFPQSHGDAYGHYLTALTGYYKLLTNDNFTWTPRSESVLVLGQNVAVDYFDERKFTGAAADLARTAEQILSLTYRQAYQDDQSGGWSHFRDNKANSASGTNRQWGVDEWASRSTQGAYFHWVNGNAMLLDEDVDPDHTGIEKVDRSTVPELALVAAAAESYQTTIDNANAFLNPLGLSPDAIAFDISPSELKAGNSHFEQIYNRSLKSVLNAKGAFDQAGRMTRLLRNQENQIDDFNTALEDEERAFSYKLSDLYGTPYPADVGPGKLYDQGYAGPDLRHWFLVDQNQASNLVDLTAPVTYTIREPVEIPPFVGIATLADFNSANYFTTKTGWWKGDNDLWETATKSVTVSPNQWIQSAPVYFGAGVATGQRTVIGELQTALAEAERAQMLLGDALGGLENAEAEYTAAHRLFVEMVTMHLNSVAGAQSTSEQIIAKTKLKKRLEIAALTLEFAASTYFEIANAGKEFLPTSFGFSVDGTAPVRGAVLFGGAVIAQVARFGALASSSAAANIDPQTLELEIIRDRDLQVLGFDLEERQFIYEYELKRTALLDQTGPVYLNAVDLQHATQKVGNLLSKGDRIQLEREIFRKRAATLVQGYRTNDVAFRTFRNEALEQYRTLYDLAARYTYLAAKSYDYETGLLGSTHGQEVFNNIVSSRALGDLTGGSPQATTSTLGDAGLAGTMAQLVADFSVAEGRLGINNPDQNGTLFSLRHELFRLLDNPNINADNAAWQQVLEQHVVSDLMSDPDASTYCLNLRKPDGSRVPGIIIPFSTTIQHGYNWFGLPLAGGDHNFSPSSFATKIHSIGAVLEGYVGMDQFATGNEGAGNPDNQDTNSLSATPYLYLIPTGTDYMRAPALGDTGVIRSWNVADQALPLPYNLGGTAFNDTALFNANGTLSEQPWILRKHQAFRPVDDPAYFYSFIPAEFTSSRLVGRSVWNSQWKLVIPAYSLLNDEEEGIERFVRSVDDIKIFLRTYSNSGN